MYIFLVKRVVYFTRKLKENARNKLQRHIPLVEAWNQRSSFLVKRDAKFLCFVSHLIRKRQKTFTSRSGLRPIFSTKIRPKIAFGIYKQEHMMHKCSPWKNFSFFKNKMKLCAKTYHDHCKNHWANAAWESYQVNIRIKICYSKLKQIKYSYMRNRVCFCYFTSFIKYATDIKHNPWASRELL